MAAEESRDSWTELQRIRQERMCYEVLRLIYHEVGGVAGEARNVRPLAFELGVWYAELYRVIEWLDRSGFILYHSGGPVVSLTEKGAAYIRTEEHRRSIRPESGP